MATRTTRTKKVTEDQFVGAPEVVETIAANLKSTPKSDPFVILIKIVSDLQSEFEKLQKEITQTKESWIIEQRTHQKQLIDRNTQEDLDRKRNQESYEYETSRKRKQSEDEFADKKASWEKSLKDQQEALQKEKQELEELRKLVAGFADEKERVVKEAQEILQKEMAGNFGNEKRMKEQEFKAERDILNLRLSTLTAENSRQQAEIENLKKALEEATRQVKDIAVRVIESGTKPQSIELPPTKIDK